MQKYLLYRINFFRLFLFSVLATLFVSCGPKIRTNIIKKYPAIDYNQEVKVFMPHDQVPDRVEVLGKVSVGEGGFTTRCGLDDVIGEAKLEARKCGGNAVKITSHKTPSLFSSCHRIEADILKISKE